MKLKKISPLSPHYREIKVLYEKSFPAVERISWIWMLVMAILGRADFLVYLDEGQIAGFTYSLKSKHVYYLLFLAVPADQHSQGYGKKILQEVAKKAGERPIFLVIEPLNQEAENLELRYRRLSFYERNGYRLTDYDYAENQEVYHVLTNQESVEIAEFERLAKLIEWSGMKVRVFKK